MSSSGCGALFDRGLGPGPPGISGGAAAKESGDTGQVNKEQGKPSSSDGELHETKCKTPPKVAGAGRSVSPPTRSTRMLARRLSPRVEVRSFTIFPRKS